MIPTRFLTPTLLLTLGLVAPSSEASQPAPSRTTTSATDRKALPRKEINLSPEARQRLARATVKQKPIRYVPLTPKEVRGKISADERPARASSNGKPKRVSNAELTKQLNAIERQLNSQGYSLRDNKTVVYHAHQLDRAKLEKQIQRVDEVARQKPERAPLTNEQLRAKARRLAKPQTQPSKPPTRRPATGVNGFLPQRKANPAASSDFVWTPSLGEPESGSAFLRARSEIT